MLFSIHRYAQNRGNLKTHIHFHPCGQLGTDGFDRERLLRTIGYSDCVVIGTFRATVRRFLSGTDLSGADLEDVRWDGETEWNEVRNWKMFRNLPEALRQQLEEMEQRQQGNGTVENAADL